MLKLLGTVFGIAFVLVALVCVASCSPQRVDTTKDKKIEHVVRVFMREPTKYSIMARVPGTPRLEMLPLESNVSDIYCKFNFFADVPAGDEMWVLVHFNDNDNPLSFDIHLRSENDVEGGGWNHGKLGSGTTQVVR
jgi:hypothetical protein